MIRKFNITCRGFALALALGFGIAMAGGTTVHADEQNDGMAGDWLSRYASARSMGLGGAFVAAADEPLGVIWNPAGLSQMDQNSVHFETIRLFEDTSINGFSLGFPNSKYPSFGVTILSLSSGDFERTNDLNESLGSFSVGETAFLISAAKNLTSQLTLGANIKIGHQSIVEFNDSGVGLDFGAIYNVSPAVRLGASVLNIGGPTLEMRSTGEKYPSEFRGGLSVYFLGGRGLVTAEIDHRSGPGASFHGGGEFWVHRILAFRFGYNDNSPAGGLSCRFAPGLRLDYGMSDHELGVTHRVGIAYQWGGFFASSEANPSVFSPIGERSVTRFNLRAKAKADIVQWRLEIVDKSDQPVRRFSGQGTPPAHIMWDGKSETGISLPDGVYRYWFVVKDAEGREIEGRIGAVEITTAGPQGSVPVFIE
jgi:hypothetical protein